MDRMRILPGTDSMAQALGGIAQAYATPGYPLKAGVVSVADETCGVAARLGERNTLIRPLAMASRTLRIAQKVKLTSPPGYVLKSAN
jgi:hypothetical protein